MTWDSTAYEVCLCALGTVEASMNYGAVNTSDVISVGILQWYAGRAANILNIMMTTNPTDWTGVPSRLTSALTAHAPSDSFWQSYYPNQDEIQALDTVMNTTGNVTIQDTQAYSDIDSYLAVGAQAGLDKDANTETAALYCNVYNRDPSSAGRILGAAGPTSSIARFLSFILNDSIESSFPSRYNRAYNIIVAQTTTGVGAGTPPTGTPNPGGDSGTPPLVGNASYIVERGSQLHLQNKDGSTLMFQRVSTGGNTMWLSSQDTTVGGGTPPPNGGGTPPPTAITDIINWEHSVEGDFAYSEGAGRLDPVASGQTDCSGLQYYAFLTYGNIDIGTYTGSQCKTGTLISTDPTAINAGTGMLPGDLVLYRWENRSPGSDPYDHTALYLGGDTVESHGGPGPGPHPHSNSDWVNYAISNGGIVMVRRHIT